MAVRLRSSLLAAFLVPTFVLLVAAALVGYFFARNVLERELGQSLSAVAGAAASQISGERMLTIEPEDDVHGTRTWRNLVALLSEVRDACGLRRVYAFDREGRVRADSGSRVDGKPSGVAPVGTELPELARDRLELERVFQGRRAASQVLFLGSDGQHYKTGFAPILLNGEVVGAVGVEGSAAFFRPLQQLRNGALLAVALGLLLTSLVAVLTARALSRPLLQLMNSARRIARGDLQTPVEPAPTFEIGALARDLDVMRLALDSRDRQLKMMLAGVAHEVKNPLGGIELFGGLLEEELASPPAKVPPQALEEARSHVQRIRDEVAYLRRIVDDFLSFARDQRLHTTPTNLGELVTQARSHVEAETQSKGLTLEASGEAQVQDVDPSLLTAALVNLVKNAVQAAPEGGTVQVRGEKREDAYVFTVADDGPGIPLEAQERIFEPFFTTRQKGTGLGLPLARKIVEAHGGSLRVSSSPGATRFTLSLPLSLGSSEDLLGTQRESA